MLPRPTSLLCALVLDESTLHVSTLAAGMFFRLRMGQIDHLHRPEPAPAVEAIRDAVRALVTGMPERNRELAIADARCGADAQRVYELWAVAGHAQMVHLQASTNAPLGVHSVMPRPITGLPLPRVTYEPPPRSLFHVAPLLDHDAISTSMRTAIGAFVLARNGEYGAAFRRIMNGHLAPDILDSACRILAGTGRPARHDVRLTESSMAAALGAWGA